MSKKEVVLCDFCDKRVAEDACSLCGKDICNTCGNTFNINFANVRIILRYCNNCWTKHVNVIEKGYGSAKDFWSDEFLADIQNSIKGYIKKKTLAKALDDGKEQN